ncbi:MAG: hypothetical protein K2P93_00245 [Alphaproteobacteria bacterium]|nr:hypothetical protein [Alphaproteobacteria bacterium]
MSYSKCSLIALKIFLLSQVALYAGGSKGSETIKPTEEEFHNFSRLIPDLQKMIYARLPAEKLSIASRASKTSRTMCLNILLDGFKHLQRLR